MATFGPASIAAGGGDYWHRNSATFFGTDDAVQFGETGASLPRHAAWWFDGVTIAQGTTITNAVLDFRTTTATVGSGTILTKISAVDEDDAAAATDDASCDTDDGIRTTAQVDWDFTLIDANDSALQTANFATVVQEIVDRVGWASGNSLLIHIADDGNNEAMQAVASYENTSYAQATLTITYTDPAQTIAVGKASETETAKSILLDLTILVGKASETETANTVSIQTPIPYHDLKWRVEDLDIRNQITLTLQDGTVINATNATSEKSYGPRGQTITSHNTSTTEAQTHATTAASTWGTEVVAADLTLKATSEISDLAWPNLLNLTIGDSVTVTATLTNSTNSWTMVVRSITWEFANEQWRLQLGLFESAGHLTF